LTLPSANKETLRFPGSGNIDVSPLTEQSEDLRLLALIARGEQAALKALYERRGGLIYSLLARMLVDEMEAQECMQDVFVLIWRKAAQYDSDRATPLTWMTMLARGRACDRLRARSRRAATHAAYQQELVSLEVETADENGRDELSEECAAALNALPDAQSQAVQMAFLRGWTHEEIARAVGEPLGTIKARIRRGLLSLRKAMKGRHE
jgi:RNA polymerase sigma-70 factor, ECF subfamily